MLVYHLYGLLWALLVRLLTFLTVQWTLVQYDGTFLSTVHLLMIYGQNIDHVVYVPTANLPTEYTVKSIVQYT